MSLFVIRGSASLAAASPFTDPFDREYASRMTTIRLLLDAPAPAPDALEHRFGGAPLVPADGGVEWPTCETCQGAMQFLGQLRLEGDRLLLLFMCQNDPGMCDEWDAEAGGNAALIVSTEGTLEPLPPPAEGEHTLGATWGAREATVTVDAAEIEEFMTAYDVARDRQEGRAVLGALGGDPAWVQGDETPSCEHCASPMTLAAQLEEGPNMETCMNFGGGVAFAFTCGCGRAKLLWQQ